MKRNALFDLFLWKDLPSERIKQYLAQLPPPRSFEKGAVIYSEREFPRAFAVVAEGKAEVLAHSGASMRMLETGDVCGVTALFGNERYASTIRAASRLKLQFIPENLLTDWMEAEPILSMNYIRFLHQRILYLNEKIRLYTEGSAEERLRRHIEGHIRPDSSVDFPGGLAAMARSLNISRTSLYRTLEQLERQQYIVKKDRKWFKL